VWYGGVKPESTKDRVGRGRPTPVRGEDKRMMKDNKVADVLLQRSTKGRAEMEPQHKGGGNLPKGGVS